MQCTDAAIVKIKTSGCHCWLVGIKERVYDDDNDHHIEHPLAHHLVLNLHLDLLLDRQDVGDCHATTSGADPTFAGQLPE